MVNERLLPETTQGAALSWDSLTQEWKRVGCIAAHMAAVSLSQYLINVISTMMVGHLGELSLSSSAIAMSFCSVTGFSIMLGYIALHMAAVYLSQYLINVISMMTLGHLGELSLSSSAIAMSFCSVTGFRIMSGLASGLETLCGQAYGAEQYRKLGNQTYSAIFSLKLVALAMSIIWFNMENLVILLGQDPIIAHEAGKFTRLLVPAIFANAIFQPLTRFYQTQSLTMPMLITICITTVFHIPLCWVLVFKTGLRNLGGALAISISNWLNVIFLVLYMTFSPACEKTRVPISLKLLSQEVGEFFRFAIPSAIMTCLQWWSYEFVILLSGLLPNPQFETSVLSACLNTISTVYGIPNGLGAAVRVSNELGAGNPRAAQIAVYSVIFMTSVEMILASGTLFATRHIFGYIFSSDKEASVSTMAPFVCLSIIIDASQGVLSGVGRGCGWQHIGAYVNLVSLYFVGVPAAAILGFWLHLQGKGLWIGTNIGALLQIVLLALVTLYTNWGKQAKKVRERIFQDGPSIENLL